MYYFKIIIKTDIPIQYDMIPTNKYIGIYGSICKSNLGTKYI